MSEEVYSIPLVKLAQEFSLEEIVTTTTTF